jgi:5-methylcytosine-specific restriction endonuclease McrA
MLKIKNQYPDNWPDIALEIKRAAGWMCEHCGIQHDPITGRSVERLCSDGSGAVLTVHHLDGNKSNCTYKNLVALCQFCHLHIQAVYKPGQLWLLDPPAWWVRRQ